jgi:hypothetical protein
MDDILIDPEETGWRGVGWIYLAKGSDQRRAIVKTVMNFEDL